MLAAGCWLLAWQWKTAIVIPANAGIHEGSPVSSDRERAEVDPVTPVKTGVSLG
jgi:hypothetical protein